MREMILEGLPGDNERFWRRCEVRRLIVCVGGRADKEQVTRLAGS